MRIDAHLCYLSIALMPHSLQERPPRVWPRKKSLHLSLSKHSLLPCSSPPPLVAPLTHVLLYSVLPSPKWPSSIVWTHNFTHIHFSQTPHSSSSQYAQTTSKYFSLHPFHHSTIYFICMSSHTTPHEHFHYSDYPT